MKYDKAGSPQRRRILAYTPYGETFIEERDVTPYKFNDSARREQNQAMLGLCRAEACLRAKHNGKELDAETGLYYYGARYYDPSAALWLGVDPLAEKYPDVSPYVYCAGNPVKYVDPDGNEIKIGTWYGRVLAKLGVDNFEAKVQKQLNNIKSISPGLNQMVTDLEKSKNTYSIKSVSEHPDNKRETDSRSGNSYRKSDKTIYFDMDKTTGYDGKERPLEAALAHELGHAENADKSNAQQYNRKDAENGNTLEQEKMVLNEINPIDRENEVRDAMGYPERSYNYLSND